MIRIIFRTRVLSVIIPLLRLFWVVDFRLKHERFYGNPAL